MLISQLAGRSSSPSCNIDAVETRSDSKWRLRRKEDEKPKEVSVDDLIKNFPSVWQMQGSQFDQSLKIRFISRFSGLVWFHQNPELS